MTGRQRHMPKMMMMSLHFRVMDLYSKQKCLQNIFSAEQQFRSYKDNTFGCCNC